MWEVLEAAAETLEEAPKPVRIGFTIVVLVPVLGLFGWAVWGLLT